MAAFGFIDGITELKKNESVTAFYTLKGTEEFLKDHFSGFPVMPGVLMFETLRQAASWLLAVSGDFEEPYFRAAGAENLKFGQFVRPGSRLEIFARLLRKQGDRRFFEGRIDLAGDSPRKALTADFTLVPVSGSEAEKTLFKHQSRRLFANFGGC